MKILVISTVRYKKNGISAVIKNQFSSEAFKDADVSFVFPIDSDPVMVRDLEDRGFRVYITSRKQPHTYWLYLKKLLLENNIDMVHIHGNSSTCVLEATAAKAANVRNVIVHAHSSSCKYHAVHKMLKPVLNWIVDGRIACSNDAGNFLFGDRSYHVINNSIDAERYRYNETWRHEVRQKYGIDSDTVLIGHIGTFTYAKNHEFLLQVFSCVRQMNKNAVLMLIGNGANISNIRQRVIDLELGEWVIFVGEIDNANEYGSAFDCFILPSRFEGLGLVLLEAQASGLSCLSSASVPAVVNVSGNVEFMDLGEPIERWAERLLACAEETDRVEKSNAAINCLISSGYHVAQVAETMKRYYVDMCK